MGVLILVGLTIVIVTVANRADNTPKTAMPVNMPSPPVVGAPVATNPPGKVAHFGDRHIVIPVGATVEETTSDAQRLIIRLRLASGKAALLLIDAGTGQKIGLINLDHAGQ